MPSCPHRLPGFKTTCLIVCGLEVPLAASILLRGVRSSMAPFGVPDALLDAPHYQDAILWVYTHMLVLGLVIGVVGRYAEGERLQRNFARLMLAAHVVYTGLDLHASDSALGTGLYHGPGSLIPVVIGLVITALFAHLALCRPAADILPRA